MGLDYVELIMRVEETFNIAITDQEASELKTVDQLYRHILCKLEVARRQGCLTSYVFYQIRRAGMQALNIPRQQIRPDTPLEALIPVENRIVQWKRLGDQLAFSLPPLVISDLLHLSMMIFWRLCLFVGLGVAWATPPSNHWGALLIVGAILLGLSSGRLCRPFATEFPVPTLGTLTHYVVANNFATVSHIQKQWREAEVWEVLKATIVDELGLLSEDVVPQARFYEDFNAG